jgi:AcrR family transcriptional regulator
MLSAMPRKTGRNDEARERSRAALLQAGAELMVEGALRNPFAALRLRALCDRAGLSTGAFYVHWASLDEYEADLARRLTEEDELAFAADFAEMKHFAEAAAGEGLTLAAIARLADKDLELLTSNPLWDAIELVNITWGRTSFREQIAQGYQAIDHQTGQIYGMLLRQAGREPRPPLDWDSIGTILQGLAEGLGLRHKIEPERAAGPPGSAISLYATAVASLLTVLTRPDNDQADVASTLAADLGVPQARTERDGDQELTARTG